MGVWIFKVFNSKNFIWFSGGDSFELFLLESKNVEDMIMYIYILFGNFIFVRIGFFD